MQFISILEYLKIWDQVKILDKKVKVLVENKLRNMFKEIQEPFIETCPKDIKNFLSYSYVLHKMCQLLSLDEFLTCFPLLKSREKLKEQDIIWEKICNQLEGGHLDQ